MKQHTFSKVVILLLTVWLLWLGVPGVTGHPTAHAQGQGIFKVTLMVPSHIEALQTWSLVVQNNLQSLGIDAGRIILDLPTILARVYSPGPSILGQTHEKGGFDILFTGWALGIDPDPYALFHSSQFVPKGFNYYLWNNTQNDELTLQISREVNRTLRLGLVKQWQVLAYDELPSIPLIYTRDTIQWGPLATGSSISNAKGIFSAYHFPAWPSIELLSLSPDGIDDTIIFAQDGPFATLNPLLGASYFDVSVFGGIFSSLAHRNDTVFKNMIPALSSGWQASPDGKTWTVNLRQDVTWHDGVSFDADDVKFTFDALQDDALASPQEAFVKGIIGGKDNVTVVDPYKLRFDLPAPYAYFVENILTYSILPRHVLGSVPYEDWRSHPFNTGIPVPGNPVKGPIGTGPYVFDRIDATTKAAYLVKNQNYFDFPEKGRSALQAKGMFQVESYIVRQIEGSDAAITALKTVEVQILDPTYILTQNHPSFLGEIGQTRWVDYDAFSVYEIGVNNRHPVLGTGEDTPLGREDPSKAALAARYIRQAISHSVPRELLIQELLNGYGSAGITVPVIGNHKTGFAVTEGFNTDLKPYTYNLTRARELLQRAGYSPTTPIAESFWEAYGIYLTSSLIVAVIMLSALYVLKTRGKPLSPVDRPDPRLESQPAVP